MDDDNVYVEEKLYKSNVFVGLEVALEDSILETIFQKEQPLRRSTCIRTFPTKYDDFDTKSSSKQNKGNDVNVTSSLYNISYNYEFNFYVVNEPSTFEEVISCDEWKYEMKREYDALIKNNTWITQTNVRDKL